MSDEVRLLEKLLRIEALHAGAAIAGDTSEAEEVQGELGVGASEVEGDGAGCRPTTR